MSTKSMTGRAFAVTVLIFYTSTSIEGSFRTCTTSSREDINVSLSRTPRELKKRVSSNLDWSWYFVGMMARKRDVAVKRDLDLLCTVSAIGGSSHWERARGVSSHIQSTRKQK